MSNKKGKKKAPQKGNSNRVFISNIPKTTEQKKQQHQWAMNNWLEGERRLNENKRKHDTYWRKQSQIPIEQKLKNIYSKTKQPTGPASHKK